MPTPADDIPDPPPEELEMAVEKLLGRPTAGVAEDRIAALEKRIAYLENQIGGLEPKPGEEDCRARPIQDLAEARKQLAEFRHQHEGRN